MTEMRVLAKCFQSCVLVQKTQGSTQMSLADAEVYETKAWPNRIFVSQIGVGMCLHPMKSRPPAGDLEITVITRT